MIPELWCCVITFGAMLGVDGWEKLKENDVGSRLEIMRPGGRSPLNLLS
jgi:hypothetical protein